METRKAAKDQQNHKEHVGGDPGHSLYAQRGLNSEPLLPLLVLPYFLLSQLVHTMQGSNWLGRQVSAVPAAWKAWVLMEYLLRHFPWLSEVAPFHSDIRHWSRVLPLPSRKPFGPSQCPKQFTSLSTVSPLIRQRVEDMCSNWTVNTSVPASGLPLVSSTTLQRLRGDPGATPSILHPL